MAVNKVLDKNRNVIIDISEDTVDALHLVQGYTAHNKNGQEIVGVLQASDKPTDTGLSGVYFYDFCGNLVYHYTKEEFLALDELPEIPAKINRNNFACTEDLSNKSMREQSSARYIYNYFIEDIIPDTWSSTKAEILQNLNDRGVVDVGALYKTPDDATWLICQNNNNSTSNNQKSIYIHFLQSESNGVQIDWGDGSPIETSPATPVFPNSTNICKMSHTYSWYGNFKSPYIIKIKAASGYIYFGECYENNKWAGETKMFSYNGSSDSYCCGLVFFGKNVKLGSLKNPWNYSQGIWYGGGYYNTECARQDKININRCFMRPVHIYSENTKEFYNMVTSYSYNNFFNFCKIILNNNTTEPNSSFANIGQSRNFDSSSVIIPNGWGGIRLPSSPSGGKVDYPVDFVPKASYALAYQNINADRVRAYIQAGIDKTASYCFQYNYALTTLYCPSSGDEYPQGLFSNCNNLTTVIFENDVTNISSSMFSGCPNLKYVYIPASVESIGGSVFSSSFSQSHTDDIIEIEPNLSGRKYGSSWLSSYFMGKIYYNGSAQDYLTEIFNGNQVTSNNGYSEHFYVLDENGTEIYKNRKYSKLIDKLDTILELPDTVTTLNLGWLSWNHKIVDIIIPNTVTYFDYMPEIGNCYLCNIYYKGTISEWLDIGMRGYQANPMYCAEHLFVLDENGTVEIGSNKYSEVKSLTMETMINNDGEVCTKGQIWGYNGGIHTIIVPNGVERLSSNAITYNNAVTKIELPDTLKYINSYACECNYSLIDITIPKNVINISSYAFRYCYSLGRVVFKMTGDLPTITNESFYEDYHIYEIENHSAVTITPGEQFSYLTRYVKNIITDSANSKFVYSNDGEVFYKDGNDCWYMGFIGEGEISFSDKITKLHTYYDYVYLNNNITSIIIPDTNSPIRTSNEWPFQYGAHIKNIHVGTWLRATSTVYDYYSHYLEHFYWKGQYCYYYRSYNQEEQRARGEPVKTYIIGYYGTNQNLSSYFCYYPMAKKIILEEGTDYIPITSLYENYFAECEEIDFSKRPVKLDSFSDNVYYANAGSAAYPEIAVPKVLKINCGSNLYNSSSYSLVSNSHYVKKIILSGTGLTNLQMSLLGGNCPMIEEIELPASLQTINGQRILNKWNSFDNIVRLKFNTMTPPTLTAQMAGVRPTNLIIVVPQGAKSAYQNATNWPDTTYIEFDPVTGEDIIEGE